MLKKDWIEMCFQKIALKMYENEQEKRRVELQNEKRNVIRNNRIIVKVNNKIVYDSKKDKELSDDLYYALLSYGLMDAINNKAKRKNSLIRYDLDSKISTIPSQFYDI